MHVSLLLDFLLSTKFRFFFSNLSGITSKYQTVWFQINTNVSLGLVLGLKNFFSASTQLSMECQLLIKGKMLKNIFFLALKLSDALFIMLIYV